MKLTDSTFKSDKSVELTDRGIELLVPDKDLYLKKENRRMDVIYAKDIKKKELYFNPEETKSLDFLTDSLKPKNYESIVKRMKEQGLHGGFTILLHGYPGTGKTECVYQIARQTGRNIKMVVISETKSYWYGQSEKLIKKIFDEYRNAENSILLFNECDGIFGSRKTIGHSSVDQTENAIQNIILQEMEVFNGILIATTNLTKNLDKAFERRFLYKIFFTKPDLKVRTFIWSDRLPFLTKQEIFELAYNFEMSGGQIDNISKKVVMKQVLTGNKPTLQEIQGFCKEEFLEQSTERRRIGFLQ
jgi:SpoVK/Ycf46/Vps4 family AAA+-type ATPase